MRTLAVVMIAALGVTGAANAGALEKALLKLGPEDRAFQVCAAKGLEVIRKDKVLKQVDRLVPDTLKRARFADSVVSAKGAAVRAKSHWYALTFECTVSDDQLKAVAFTYTLGDEIPPEKWEDVGLWR